MKSLRTSLLFFVILLVIGNLWFAYSVRAYAQLPTVYAISNKGEVLDFKRIAQSYAALEFAKSEYHQMSSVIPVSIENNASQINNLPLVIIGDDNRVKVNNTTQFPWSAVVQIEGKFGDQFAFKCSGWMLGPSTVVTSGHCLYDYGSSYLFASDLVVTPALNSDTVPAAPFGSCTANRLWIINLWRDNGDSRYDYGVIGLTCRIGELTGSLGYRVMADNAINGAPVNVTGYPSDKNGTTMWFGLGNITNIAQNYLYYNNDTESSQSGGPVWELIPDGCSVCVTAIHSGSPNPTTNLGVRVNNDLFDFLTVLKRWEYGRVFLPLILNFRNESIQYDFTTVLPLKSPIQAPDSAVLLSPLLVPDQTP